MSINKEEFSKFLQLIGFKPNESDVNTLFTSVQSNDNLVHINIICQKVEPWKQSTGFFPDS